MNTTNPQELDKQLIADSFKASEATYEKNALVQKEIGRQLITFLRSCNSFNPSQVLEIGCCTGILTELVVATKKIDTLYVNDIVPEFCKTTSERVAEHVGKVECLVGDIEQCILPKNLDLIISSATFQWIADLPALFGKIHGVLRDDGYLIFSIFGPGTMKEISALTGRSLQYHSREKISEMLQGNFDIRSMRSDIREIYFPTVLAVLQHIRQTGVGGLGRGKWIPGKYKEFAKQYSSRFATEKGLPVTYASTFVVAIKR